MEYEKVDENGLVICQICGKSLKNLGTRHIQLHDLTIDEYKEMYPDYPIVCDELLQNSGKKRGPKPKVQEVIAPDEYPIDRETDDPLPENSDIEEIDFSIIEKLVEQARKSHSVNKNDPTVRETSHTAIEDDLRFVTTAKKNLFLNLKTDMLPSLRINFWVRKVLPGNRSAYAYLSDMCDVMNKVVLSFPDTFWHNDPRTSHMIEQALKNDGWRIMNIRGKSPSKEDVLNEYSKYNIFVRSR